MNIPSPQANPLAWDKLLIDGHTMPGKARVSVKVADRLDIRKPPGYSKAVLVDKGRPIYEGKIELEFGFEGNEDFGTAEEQWAAWFSYEEIFWGNRNKARDGFRVAHPEFARKGIKEVYLSEPGDLKGEGTGTRKVEFSWFESGKIYPDSTGTGGKKVGAAQFNVKGKPSLADLKKTNKPSASETGP